MTNEISLDEQSLTVPEDKKESYTISPSELEVLFRCETEHGYRYEEGFLPLERNPKADRGEVVHSMLRSYYEWKRAELEGKEQKKFAEVLDETIKGTVSRKTHLSGPEVEDCKKVVYEYLNYYKSEGWIPVFIEHWINYLLYESETRRYFLYGKIDLGVIIKATGEKAIVDTKTSDRFTAISPIAIQPQAYCLATGVNKFIYNLIGFQKTYKIYERLRRPAYSYTPEQLEEFKQNIILKIQKFEVSQVLAYREMNYSACIRFFKECDYLEVCTAGQASRRRRLGAHFVRRADKAEQIISAARDELKGGDRK